MWSMHRCWKHSSGWGERCRMVVNEAGERGFLGDQNDGCLDECLTQRGVEDIGEGICEFSCNDPGSVAAPAHLERVDFCVQEGCCVP